jgi:PPOX class probable F420-dependent enzyme
MNADFTADQERFLDEERVGRLGTVDDAGRPHVVPVCFALVNGLIYSAIDEKPKRVDARGDPRRLQRVRNILAHPEVSLLVDRYDEDWSRLAWIQIRGLASLVDDDAEGAPGLAGLIERYPQYRAMDLVAAPLLCIEPLQIIAWRASPS